MNGTDTGAPGARTAPRFARALAFLLLATALITALALVSGAFVYREVPHLGIEYRPDYELIVNWGRIGLAAALAGGLAVAAAILWLLSDIAERK